VDLHGVRGVSGGTVQVLQGEPGDVNSIAEPRKVAPKSEPLAGAGPAFRHAFPPYSVSVLRLKAR
jgi:alpha-L-arabinofuranosidase